MHSGLRVGCLQVAAAVVDDSVVHICCTLCSGNHLTQAIRGFLHRDQVTALRSVRHSSRVVLLWMVWSDNPGICAICRSLCAMTVSKR